MNSILSVFIGALLVLTPSITAAADSFVVTKPQEPLVRATRFDNQMLLRAPKSRQFFDLAQELNLDIWSVGKTTVEVRADAKQKKELERRLKTISVLDSNIQRRIDAETAALNKQLATSRRFAVGDEDWHKQYHTYEDIVNWYKAVAAKFPTLIKFNASVGKSFEGRDMPMLELTGAEGDNKRNIYFQTGQHAREWIGPATVQYIVDKLTSGYGSDTRVTALLNKVRFVIMPIMNPDGYVYSWKTNRLWRKNRGYVQNGRASGVDLNRNWPDHWADQGGASTSPSSDTFKGPSAGSESEVQTAIKVYHSYAEGMIGAIDFHSYSELLLRAHGWTETRSPDEAAFVELGEKMKNDIKASRGTVYTSERSIDLYKVTGAASDWFYGSSTTGKETYRSYGITIELSPNSFSFGGFELPPQYILPVGKEIFPAILTYGEYCLSRPLKA